MAGNLKLLLKSTLGNVVSILGYVSTAATFIPFMNVARPYMRPAGIVLIIVGILKGSLTLLGSKDAEARRLLTEKDEEIEKLTQEIRELQTRPYNEDLRKTTDNALAHLGEDGKALLRHLLKHEPIEVGRPFTDQIPMERQNSELAVAMKYGLIRHKEDRHGAMIYTWFIVTPQFKPVLEDALYGR